MDAVTVERARQGDGDARASLLRELQDVWFRVCISLLSSRDRADDAVQESALRFLRQLPTFRGGSTLRTFAIGIAINVVRETRRQASRSPAGPDERSVESPLESAQRSESNQRLRTALAELPDRQREVVVLRFFEGLTTEEAAAAMQCAEGTVKATLFQALRGLRGKLKELV